MLKYVLDWFCDFLECDLHSVSARTSSFFLRCVLPAILAISELLPVVSAVGDGIMRSRYSACKSNFCLWHTLFAQNQPSTCEVRSVTPVFAFLHITSAV